MAPLSDPSELNIEKKSIQLKFNVKEIVSAGIRTAFDISIQKLSGGTLPAWAKAISFKNDKERLAFLLIGNSLTSAVQYQLQVEANQGDIERKTGKLFYANQEMHFKVFEGLADNQYSLKAADFQNPRSLALLADFMPFYRDWMKSNFGMSNTKAEHLAADFRNYFALDFVQLLGNPTYATLNNWLENPNLAKQVREYEHYLYQSELRNKFHRLSMGLEKVALSDIYVEPQFRVYDKIKSPENSNRPMERRTVAAEHFVEVDYKHSIHDYFRHHFLTQKPSEAINSEAERSRLLVLLGQPGHGKSSFCYRTAHDLLHSSDFAGNVFFIPLRRVSREVLNKPLDEFHAVLEEEVDFTNLFKNNKKAPNVLLLDGLDEWRMAERITDAEVLQLFEKCKTLIDRRKNLFIVVTSRFNYITTDKLHDKNALIFSLDTMSLAQQWTFVKAFYGKAKPTEKRIRKKDLEKINKESAYLRELIELPILLQFILMADVDVMAADSRGKIYKNLFDNVLSRKWDQNKTLEHFKKSFKPKHLRQYMSFLAFKIFQHKEDFLSRYEIQHFSETEEFITKHIKGSKVTAGLQAALKDVLTSFYLNESRKKEQGKRNDPDRENAYAIEFMHKSLYEYLACEYLWKEVKAFFLKKKEIRFRTFEETIAQWRKWLATTRFTGETAGYLREIIQADTQCHKKLQKAMSKHLVELADHSFLDKYEMPKTPEQLHYTPDQQVINIFGGFWLIYGELNQHLIEEPVAFFEEDWPVFWEKYMTTVNHEKIITAFENTQDELIAKEQERYETREEIIKEWEAEKEIFKTWFLEQPNEEENQKMERWLKSWRFRQQGKEMKHKIGLNLAQASENFLRLLKIHGIENLSYFLQLGFLDMADKNLRSWIGPWNTLRGVDLRSAYLRFADLRFADLSFADLRFADLSSADLSFADLSYADLSSAHLSYADLSSADLSYAHLISANLRSAYLISADLISADLISADLRDADLNYAKVHSIDWLEELEKGDVIGIAEIKQKYKVVRIVEVEDKTGKEIESFRVRLKSELEEEEE